MSSGRTKGKMHVRTPRREWEQGASLVTWYHVRLHIWSDAGQRVAEAGVWEKTLDSASWQTRHWPLCVLAVQTLQSIQHCCNTLQAGPYSIVTIVYRLGHTTLFQYSLCLCLCSRLGLCLSLCHCLSVPLCVYVSLRAGARACVWALRHPGYMLYQLDCVVE